MADSTLVMQDGAVALAPDNIILTETEFIQSPFIALTSDGIALTQKHTLAMQDATVALTPDSIAVARASMFQIQRWMMA